MIETAYFQASGSGSWGGEPINGIGTRVPLTFTGGTEAAKGADDRFFLLGFGNELWLQDGLYIVEAQIGMNVLWTPTTEGSARSVRAVSYLWLRDLFEGGGGIS